MYICIYIQPLAILQKLAPTVMYGRLTLLAEIRLGRKEPQQAVFFSCQIINSGIDWDGVERRNTAGSPIRQPRSTGIHSPALSPCGLNPCMVSIHPMSPQAPLSSSTLPGRDVQPPLEPSSYLQSQSIITLTRYEHTHRYVTMSCCMYNAPHNLCVGCWWYFILCTR